MLISAYHAVSTAPPPPPSPPAIHLVTTWFSSAGKPVNSGFPSPASLRPVILLPLALDHYVVMVMAKNFLTEGRRSLSCYKKEQFSF